MSIWWNAAMAVVWMWFTAYDLAHNKPLWLIMLDATLMVYSVIWVHQAYDKKGVHRA